MIWFLQIAQLSTTISATRNEFQHQHSDIRKKKSLGLEGIPQAQSATALHFLISNRLGFLEDEEGPALLDASPAGTMGTSESKVAIATTIGSLMIQTNILRNFPQ